MIKRKLSIFFDLRSILYVLLCLFSHTVNSQDFNVGLKLGGSYSLNDNGSEIFGKGERFSAESDFGYLGGVFLELRFRNWMVRPEAFLNRALGEFVFPSTNSEYAIDKLSFPLLVGYRVLGRLDVYSGPVYQLILDKTLENSREPIALQHNNLAAQFGIKIRFNRWEIDLRYDFTMPSDEFQNIDIKNYFNSGFFDDGRLNQVLLSLNYKLFGSDVKRTRRGVNCYF